MYPETLFEFFNTVLMDLRNSTKNFGGMVVVIAGDYSLRLSLVSKTRRVSDGDGNIRFIQMSLLRELPWYDCEL